MMEEENPFFNDFSSEEINQPKKFSPKLLKELIILGAILVLITVLIITIIFSLKSSTNIKRRKLLWTIYCIYDIKEISKETIILSNDFQKITNFDIFIGDRTISFSNFYLFPQTGENELKFELYEDISINNMFKDVSALISVKMRTQNNLKILSMESSFENCYNLKVIDIRGFNNEKNSVTKKDFLWM